MCVAQHVSYEESIGQCIYQAKQMSSRSTADVCDIVIALLDYAKTPTSEKKTTTIITIHVLVCGFQLPMDPARIDLRLAHSTIHYCCILHAVYCE